MFDRGRGEFSKNDRIFKKVTKFLFQGIPTSHIKRFFKNKIGSGGGG